MFRGSRYYYRTSRKGPGSWNDVILRTPRASTDDDRPCCSTTSPYSSPRSSSPAPSYTGPRGPPSASPTNASTPYDAHDNARFLCHSDGPVKNWKADPARGHANMQDNVLFRNGMRGTTLGSGRFNETGARGEASSANWLGGNSTVSLSSSAVRRHFGVDDFSMVDRQQLTLTKLMRIAMDATFKPRDPDSRAFGGDGATHRAEQKEELKNMDQRIVPYAHEHIMNDYLKNIQQLNGPSGQLCDRQILKGRLVGLLFFTESERSASFMRSLKVFHTRHQPDFVVVAVSLAGKEMLDVSRAHGFFHCTHRNGATWVKRDAGLMVRPLTPLPRLVIVDGSSGEEVTRCGLTAVLTHPQTCFAEWRRGMPGCDWHDFLKVIYI